MRTFSVLRVLPAAALFLAACGDGSLRSPDLPGETLSGIGPLNCSFPGAQNRLAVDQTGTCGLPSQCSYRGVDAEGQVRERHGLACPDGLSLSSSQPGVATIAADGTVTGVTPGTTQITASGHGLTSPATTVTVTAACGVSLAITPTMVTLISGSSSGTSQRLTATLTLSDGATVDVSTVASTRWTSSDTAILSFTGNQATARPGVAAATTVTATARYDGNVCAGSSELSANVAIAVRPAQVIANGGLCIETIPPSTAFTGCRADTGACPTPTAPIELSIGQSRQLLIRGRFDDGMECNVTADATLGTGSAAIASVSSAQLVGQGGGSTTVTAAFGGRNTSRPVQVTVNQVLGNNSLAVFARAGFTDSQSISLADAQQRKFSCVGANNLLLDGLGNRTPRGALQTFAYAAGCPSNQLDADGNCTADAGGGARSAAAFIANAATQNVSNLPPRAGGDPLDDGIVWRSVAGYWGMNPTTQALSCITETSNPSAHVGDVHVAGERRLAVGDDGLPIEAGSGPRGQLQANGLVYADGAVRVGFNCVTATYSNPEDPADTQTDGMTVLVLPAVNDILLSGSNDGYALCESLAPLFGSEPLLRLVETPSVLSRVTAQLSPLLEQLDAVPIDSLLTTLQTDILGPVTGPLIDALDEYVIDPVLEPVLCQVGTAVNRLLALLTNTEPTQACPAP